MHHKMSLRPGPFAKIANGTKRYELRLHDEKRRRISVGDTITFTCTDGRRRVHTRVISLHPFDSFAALYAALPMTECGYAPGAVADPHDMEAYYPPEKQAQYGVLAIRVERIRLPIDRLSGTYGVRMLTEGDVPDMLRLALGNPLYYRHMGIVPDAQNIAETLTALPPRMALADKYFFGWFDGERLVALMDLIQQYPDENKAFIGWFMVDADKQGCGLGRKLVADVTDMLREAGFHEVRLGRVEGNPQSEAFWHACGFEENGLSYDTDGYRVIVMQKGIK